MFSTQNLFSLSACRSCTYAVDVQPFVIDFIVDFIHEKTLHHVSQLISFMWMVYHRQNVLRYLSLYEWSLSFSRHVRSPKKIFWCRRAQIFSLLRFGLTAPGHAHKILLMSLTRTWRVRICTDTHLYVFSLALALSVYNKFSFKKPPPHHQTCHSLRFRF